MNSIVVSPVVLSSFLFTSSANNPAEAFTSEKNYAAEQEVITASMNAIVG